MDVMLRAGMANNVNGADGAHHHLQHGHQQNGQMGSDGGRMLQQIHDGTTPMFLANIHDDCLVEGGPNGANAKQEHHQQQQYYSKNLDSGDVFGSSSISSSTTNTPLSAPFSAPAFGLTNNNNNNNNSQHAHQHPSASFALPHQHQVFFPPWGSPEDLKFMQEMATMVNEANASHQQPNDEELNLMENGNVHGMEMIGPTQANWPNHLLQNEGHQQPFQPYTNATKCKKSGNHIKRPMNAFMVWSREERLKICSIQPDKHNAEISKELGLRWRRMSKEERRPYEAKAEELRQLHCLEYPDYKYKPRKKIKKAQTASMGGGESSTKLASIANGTTEKRRATTPTAQKETRVAAEGEEGQEGENNDETMGEQMGNMPKSSIECLSAASCSQPFALNPSVNGIDFKQTHGPTELQHCNNVADSSISYGCPSYPLSSSSLLMAHSNPQFHSIKVDHTGFHVHPQIVGTRIKCEPTIKTATEEEEGEKEGEEVHNNILHDNDDNEEGQLFLYPDTNDPPPPKGARENLKKKQPQNVLKMAKMRRRNAGKRDGGEGGGQHQNGAKSSQAPQRQPQMNGQEQQQQLGMVEMMGFDFSNNPLEMMGAMAARGGTAATGEHQQPQQQQQQQPVQHLKQCSPESGFYEDNSQLICSAGIPNSASGFYDAQMLYHHHHHQQQQQQQQQQQYAAALQMHGFQQQLYQQQQHPFIGCFYSAPSTPMVVEAVGIGNHPHHPNGGVNIFQNAMAIIGMEGSAGDINNILMGQQQQQQPCNPFTNTHNNEAIGGMELYGQMDQNQAHENGHLFFATTSTQLGALADQGRAAAFPSIASKKPSNCSVVGATTAVASSSMSSNIPSGFRQTDHNSILLEQQDELRSISSGSNLSSSGYHSSSANSHLDCHASTSSSSSTCCTSTTTTSAIIGHPHFKGDQQQQQRLTNPNASLSVPFTPITTIGANGNANNGNPYQSHFSFDPTMAMAMGDFYSTISLEALNGNELLASGATLLSSSPMDQQQMTSTRPAAAADHWTQNGPAQFHC